MPYSRISRSSSSLRGKGSPSPAGPSPNTAKRCVSPPRSSASRKKHPPEASLTIAPGLHKVTALGRPPARVAEEIDPETEQVQPMHITATGKQIDVGKYLRDHVETATTMIVGKYFDKAIEAHIIFYRERHLILANVMVHAIGGMAVQCHGEADTATAAFDQAITRLDKRLRRFKRRLRNHHAKSKLDGNIPAEGENE